MTKEKLNIVVTCTKTKTIKVPEPCRLRNKLYKDCTSVKSKFQLFKKQLTESTQQYKIADLYAGAHWKTILNFSSTRYKIDTWVCSAGLGLVNINDMVPPYDVTFSLNHPDSVAMNIEPNTMAKNKCPHFWWQQLTNWTPSFANGPRSITELATSHPNTPLLVLAPVNYMLAIEQDLLSASNIADPELFSIVSTGSDDSSPLRDHILPTEGRLRNILGGVLRSINTNIADHLLRQPRLPMKFPKLQSHLRKMLDNCPELNRFEDRVDQDDDQIRDFITRELATDSSKTVSRLLRTCRDNGKRCGAERFKRIFDDVAPNFKGVDRQ